MFRASKHYHAFAQSAHSAFTLRVRLRRMFDAYDAGLITPDFDIGRHRCPAACHDAC